MGRLIFDERDLTNVEESILKGIDRAVVAAAFRIRDNMRAEFAASKSIYKNATEKYDKLAEGIMIGKLNNSQIKIHALGNKDNYDTYKTRFFVGGTEVRKGTTSNGNAFTKGYIKPNDAVTKGLNGGQDILNNFINNVLENGK